MDPEDPAFHQPAWAVRQFNPYPDVYGKRPSFGQWLKQTWPDIITMIFTGAVGLIVFHLPPAPSRSIAVTYANGQIVYPEFAYPQRQVTVPIWLATFLASGIPIAAILLSQIRIRSFWDANNGITGLLYGLVTAATLQALVKWLIGGLRPHFLDVCQPDPDILEGASGSGYGNLYYTSEICTGDAWDVRDSLESFPSGHSTAAFAGFVYLSLYLNAKLKVFSDSVRFTFSTAAKLGLTDGTASGHVEADTVMGSHPGRNSHWWKPDYRRLPQLVRRLGRRDPWHAHGLFGIPDRLRLHLGLEVQPHSASQRRTIQV